MLLSLTFIRSFMNRMRSCYLLALCLVSFVAISQKNLVSLADGLFSQKKYNEAIPVYTKVFEKTKDRTVLLKMADCNYLNENYKPAQKLYAEYFRDSVYENIPQFTNYANASKLTGKVALAVKLFQKIYEITQDESAKNNYEIYKYYLDNISNVRVYDLDADYNCIVLDASESADSAAAPLFYLWDFGNGETKEGMLLEHCFDKGGEHKVVLSIRDVATGVIKTNDTTLTVFVDSPPVIFAAPKIGRRYFYLDFDASQVDIPGYNIVDYLWDMDNGDLIPGKKIKFRYNESTDYHVKLTVIAQSKYTNNKEIYSSTKKIEIRENYETPSKKFTDALNESK
jgi:tetratricopeptide (TPR) repeat protein